MLDDDPTGIQTVHGCLLLTQWDEESVRQGFADEVPFFYILTNTRAMTRSEAATVTRNAMEMVVKVNRDYGYLLIIVSRSDSCLRGHFPLETDVMRDVLMHNGYDVAEKTPFCPAFIEAGRVTIDGVHYMKDAGRFIPVSETEFARDNVFAYYTSVLTEYIREKGANPADYEIVDAQSYDELYAFAQHLTSTLIPQPSTVNSHPHPSSSVPPHRCPRLSVALATSPCSTTASFSKMGWGALWLAVMSKRRHTSWNACWQSLEPVALNSMCSASSMTVRH